MAACGVCHSRHRWWRTFFGTFTIFGWTVTDTRWVECKRCGEHYCGKCFRLLKEATGGDPWWSPYTVRICRICGADLFLPPAESVDEF